MRAYAPGLVQEVLGQGRRLGPGGEEGQAVDGQADGAGQHQRPQEPALPEVQQREHEDVEPGVAPEDGVLVAERHSLPGPQDGLPLPGGGEPHHHRQGQPPQEQHRPPQAGQGHLRRLRPAHEVRQVAQGARARPGGVTDPEADLGRPREALGHAPRREHVERVEQEEEGPAEHEQDHPRREGGQERPGVPQGVEPQVVHVERDQAPPEEEQGQDEQAKRGEGPGQTRSHRLTVLAAGASGAAAGRPAGRPASLRGNRMAGPPGRGSQRALRIAQRCSTAASSSPK